MTDREKLIKGLECCLANAHNKCSYKSTDEGIDKVTPCTTYLMQDALALLKAQEPRVMTLEEVKIKRICWIEDADDGMTVRLFPATMFGTCEHANGAKSCIFLARKPWAIDVNDYEWWYLSENYSETWRCWTSRPTDEQREAIMWEI